MWDAREGEVEELSRALDSLNEELSSLSRGQPASRNLAEAGQSARLAFALPQVDDEDEWLDEPPYDEPSTSRES